MDRIHRWHTRLSAMAIIAAITFACLDSPFSFADHVLLRYKGRPVTVLKYTLVRYSAVQKLIKVLQKSPRLADCKPMLVLGVEPAQPHWHPREDTSLLAYYRHVLNGAIFEFVRCKVAVEFSRRYPKDKGVGRDDPMFLRTVKLMARIGQPSASALADALLNGWDRRKLAQYLRNAYKRWRGIRNYALILHYLRPFGSYYILAVRSAPGFKSNTVAPWYFDQFYADTLLSRIQLQVNRHKARYIRLLNREMGDRRYFLATFVHRSDQIATKSLIEHVSKPNGTLSQVNLERASQILATLHSPTVLQTSTGGYTLISKIFHIPQSRLATGAFIPLGDADGRTDFQYLYISQAKPNAANVSHSIKPAGFLFQIAMEHLLTPITKSVLSKLQVAAGLRLPSSQAVFKSLLATWPFPKELYGVPIPKVEN